MPKLASPKYCTGCLACIDSCKHNAINSFSQNGLKYVTVDATKCIDCKLCEKACPIITPIQKNKVTEMTIYGGWCKNDEYRINAASGGAFAAIALSFFKQFGKATIAGATLENNKVKHILINDGSEIRRLMNSKYIQSDTSGIYEKVKQKLRDGYHVLFSGTPCQIAGLYGYLGKYKLSELLYTVEIICHGVPGEEALDLHLKYHHASSILSFRDKKKGWGGESYRTTIVINSNPHTLNKSQDIFHQIFSSCLLDRRSCSNCIYSSINRAADITLADFWGKEFNLENTRKGVSLIIANNSRGKGLIQTSSELYTFNSNLKEAINGQPRLYDGFKYIQYHPLALFPNFFKRILPESLRLSILTNRMPWKLLWGCYRLASILHTKNMKRNILKKYCK